MQVAGGKKRWLTSVGAYSFAGTVSSAALGSVLGLLGGLLFPRLSTSWGLSLGLMVAAFLLAREAGWLRFSLPQLKRQTRDEWIKFFPPVVTASLWGFDLGLVFTTWLTFSGVWLLALMSILIGDPSFGATLFVSHWLGRSASVWIGPLLLRDAKATPELLTDINGSREVIQLAHIAGIAWAAVVLAVWLAHGIPL